jgi:hypothetical protein
MKKSKRPKCRFILYCTSRDQNILKLNLKDLFLYNHTYFEYTNLNLRLYELENNYSLIKVAKIYCEFIKQCLNLIVDTKTLKTFHSYRKYKQFIDNV